MTSYKRLLVALVALCVLASARAQVASLPQNEAPKSPWDAPAAELARQIAALSGPGTVTLAVTNRSSFPSDDVPKLRRMLERELRRTGVTVRDKNADCDVRVTLSQNVQGWLWVAEVQEGIEIKVAMLPVEGAKASLPAEAAPAITLRATPLTQRNEPLLDFAVIGSGAEQYTVTLGPDKIYWRYASLGDRAGQSSDEQTYDIGHAEPMPRDPRGRIVPAKDHVFDAYLPGMVCAAIKTGGTSALSITCRNSDEPWPLGSQTAFYNAARNFFTGVVVPGFGPKLPAFYSEAELSHTTGTAFLFADVSGAVHILESGSHKLLIGARDWGSDIAAVRSQCGSGSQVLASQAGWPDHDSIRAYEISGREATPASAPLNFDGVITALWPAADGTAVTAVVWRPTDNDYLAYSVSVACGR
jgi:hypothetical protein